MPVLCLWFSQLWCCLGSQSDGKPACSWSLTFCWQVAILAIPTSRKTTLTSLCLPVTWTWCGWLRHSPQGKCFIHLIGDLFGAPSVFQQDSESGLECRIAGWGFTAGLGFECNISNALSANAALLLAALLQPGNQFSREKLLLSSKPFCFLTPRTVEEEVFFLRASEIRFKGKIWKNYQGHFIRSLFGISLFLVKSWPYWLKAMSWGQCSELFKEHKKKQVEHTEQGSRTS